MLDPDDDFTVQDYETVQFNSIVTQYREAVANETEQNQVPLSFTCNTEHSHFYDFFIHCY